MKSIERYSEGRSRRRDLSRVGGSARPGRPVVARHRVDQGGASLKFPAFFRFSTLRSAERGEVRLWPILETIVSVVAMAWFCVALVNSWAPILWVSVLAPLFLMRTEASTERGIRMYLSARTYLIQRPRLAGILVAIPFLPLLFLSATFVGELAVFTILLGVGMLFIELCVFVRVGATIATMLSNPVQSIGFAVDELTRHEFPLPRANRPRRTLPLCWLG